MEKIKISIFKDLYKSTDVPYIVTLEKCLNRIKIGKSNKGKIVSDEVKIKMSKAAKGRICLEETRSKISKSNKGKHLGSKNSFYGKKHSEATKRKISKAGVGRPSYWSGRKRSEETRKKQSESMKGKMVGSGHPLWNNSITVEERLIKRNYMEYKEWRSKVYERDEFICQKCEQVSGKLNAHHIESYSTNRELRTIIENGITFCKSCHKDFHSIYGKKTNTRIQLEQFLIKGV